MTTRWALIIGHTHVEEYPSEDAAREALHDLAVEGVTQVLMRTDDHGEWVETS